MSSHNVSQPLLGSKAISIIDVKNSDKNIAMLTAYDFPSAILADRSGVDIVLIGDSLGMVVLGRKDTVDVTLDEMIHHTRCVVAGVSRALVVADMPFMSYEISVEQALTNATTLAQKTGVRAVKIEGCKKILPQVDALVSSGIGVMGHLGLTPQRATTLGGFKVQGKTALAAKVMLEDALALQAAGCFSIVLEAVPAYVGEMITDRLSIPTIGIGAGGQCRGQVLVWHDMLGLNSGHVPKFVKQYAELNQIAGKAIANYVEEVKAGVFPAKEHCFSMPQEEEQKLRDML